MVHRDMAKGNGFLILYLTPSKVVSPLISEPLHIIEVLPNYTLGGFFGALYHTDSENNPVLATGRGPVPLIEFSIITALIRCNEKKGFYLSPVARITRPELMWEKRGLGFSLWEREGFPSYISLRVMPITPRIPLRFNLPFIEMKGEGVVLDRILPVTKMAFSSSSIHIPPSSPLSGLPFKFKIFSIIFSLDQVVVEEPKMIKGKILKELKTGVYG